MALAELQHHTVRPTGTRARAGGVDREENCEPRRQAQCTSRWTMDDDEEMFAARVWPAPLSEVAGPQERVLWHIVEQIVDFRKWEDQLAPLPRVWKAAFSDEKTAQLVGNIEVVDGTLTPNDRSDCVWVWRATQQDEALAVMFANKAIAHGFKEAFDGGQVLAKGIRSIASPGRLINTGHHTERPA